MMRFGVALVFALACGLPCSVARADEEVPETPSDGPSREEIEERQAERRAKREEQERLNREYEAADPEEEEEAVPTRKRKKSDGGGPDPKAVGLGLTISGLIVGFGGGIVGTVGGITGDTPSQIIGAVLGGVGGALSLSGTIVMLTAPAPAAASWAPNPSTPLTVRVAAGPVVPGGQGIALAFDF